MYSCLSFFRFLDTLDISFNFFGHENDIVGVIYLSRLETFLLYGNPVLGPTGEDPMFIYIEDVVDKANDHRDSIQSTISYIDVSFRVFSFSFRP